MSTTQHPPPDDAIRSIVGSVAEDGWEIHYAPMTGDICLMKEGQVKPDQGWLYRNDILETFLRHRANGQLTLKETVNYGHSLFQGHRGRVDIYAWNHEHLS